MLAGTGLTIGAAWLAEPTPAATATPAPTAVSAVIDRTAADAPCLGKVRPIPRRR